MKLTFLSIFAACLFVTGAMAADAAAGKALFATKCKACHGPDGTPPPAMAKALGVKPFSESQGKSDADLKTAILKGSGKMKAQAVSDSDADNLVAAIRTMK
jgi:mono/diheme cytochrome c family protein